MSDKDSFCRCFIFITMILESLDFLYVPAPDIHASVSYYTDVLDGELMWKIHDFGVWVACIRLANSEKPYVLLADHINKNDVMLIYRVENLQSAVKELQSKDWKEESTIEIPPGPCCTFRDPVGNALVIYENMRPFVIEQFKGRIDTITTNDDL